jgi:hypothetical protein
MFICNIWKITYIFWISLPKLCEWPGFVTAIG